MLQKSKRIIYLVPPEKIVNGGVMSIFSLTKETRAILRPNEWDVALSVYPETNTYGINDLFQNTERILDFSSAIKISGEKLDKLILHIPEGDVQFVYEAVLRSYDLSEVATKIHINILNQNINYMPSIDVVTSLYNIASTVTQTTAHDRYSNQAMADKYGIPTHHFSVYIDKKNYTYQSFDQKDDLILYSNDTSIEKSKVIRNIKRRLPGYELKEIKNMTYHQYLKEISRSKFVITFGEGMDGYFIEPIFSGSLSFSVYNDTFFPDKSYLELSNVCSDYDELTLEVEKAAHMSPHDNTLLSAKISEKLGKLYSHERYINKIKRFYEGQYDYSPSQPEVIQSLKEAIALKDSAVVRYDQALRDQEHYSAESLSRIQALSSENSRLKDQLSDIENSRSWKVLQKVKRIARR